MCSEHTDEQVPSIVMKSKKLCFTNSSEGKEDKESSSEEVSRMREKKVRRIWRKNMKRSSSHKAYCV